MKLRVPIALAGLLALALTGCSSASTGSGANASGSTTLKVGTIGLSSDAALKIGIDKGFFKDEKLNIEVSTIANPPAGIAAAQSGQLDLAYSPSIPLLNALSQHVPLKVVSAADGYEASAKQPANLAEVDDTGLFVAKGSSIASVKDLAGKTIAIPARKAQLEVTISKVIKDAGGDPSTVKWMVLDFSSALQSLNAGRVDAAGLVAPFTGKAEAAGDVRLASPGVAFFKEGRWDCTLPAQARRRRSRQRCRPSNAASTRPTPIATPTWPNASRSAPTSPRSRCPSSRTARTRTGPRPSTSLTSSGSTRNWPSWGTSVPR